MLLQLEISVHLKYPHWIYLVLLCAFNIRLCSILGRIFLQVLDVSVAVATAVLHVSVHASYPSDRWVLSLYSLALVHSSPTQANTTWYDRYSTSAGLA